MDDIMGFTLTQSLNNKDGRTYISLYDCKKTPLKTDNTSAPSLQLHTVSRWTYAWFFFLNLGSKEKHSFFLSFALFQMVAFSLSSHLTPPVSQEIKSKTKYNSSLTHCFLQACLPNTENKVNLCIVRHISLHDFCSTCSWGTQFFRGKSDGRALVKKNKKHSTTAS